MDAPIPTAPSDNRISVPVLGGGLITGALALLGVFWLNQATDGDANVMGWYANFVIPVGAILVGLVAGLGYGLAAWWMDRRVNNLMIVLIVVLQLGVYLAAQYVEYRHLLSLLEEGYEPAPFWEYFDQATRNFAFKKEHSDQMGEPLGVWGYAIRALEMAGFAFGGLISPLILRALPYCHTCGVYMKSRPLGLLPASLPAQKFKKDDEEGRAAFARAEEEVLAESLKVVEQLGLLAAQGHVDAIVQQMTRFEAERKANAKLSSRLQLTLNECRMCGNGALNVTAHRRQGNTVAQVPVGSYPLIINADAAPADPNSPRQAVG